jgi:hypothetical protein
MATKQDNAVTFANWLLSLAQTAQNLRANLADAVKRYNSENYNTVWNAMATAVQNADGSLGTADGTPNVAHPLDTRVFANLSKAVSATQLVAMITFANDFASFLGNVAVGTSQRSQTIDDLVG